MFTGEEMRKVFLEKLEKDKSFDAAIWKVAWVAYCRGIEDAKVPLPKLKWEEGEVNDT